VGSRSSEAQSPTQVQGAQFCSAAAGGIETAVLCLLLPVEQ
jgi:hypothetical protein